MKKTIKKTKPAKPDLDRSSAEQSLRNSELRYRRLFEAARDGILILDAETGMVVDANPFLIEMLGFSREQFLGKKIWELGFFKDIAANQDNFAELQRKEYVRYADLPLETSDGQRIEVEFVSNVYQVNHHKVIQCNVRDITDRKRAEAALQESEARARAILNAIPDLMFRLDRQGVFLDFKADEKDLYTQSSKIIGNRYRDIMPPEFTALMDCHSRATLETGQMQVFEYQLLMPGLGVHDYEARMVAGGNDEVVAFVRDITARKRTEAALRETQARLQHLFAASPVVIYSITPDFATTWVAQNVEYVLGYTVAESQAPGWWADHLHPDDRQRVLAGLPDVFERAQYAHEYRFQFKDSSYHWIHDELRVIRDAQGNLVEIIGAWQDITARKRTEVALQESEARYRAVAQTARDAIISADHAGNIVGWNQGAERVFGYTEAEAIGRALILLVPPQYGGQHLAGFQRIQAEGNPHIIGKTVELSGLRKDGSEFPLEFALSEWQVAEGKFYTGIIRDITERKQVEEKLKELSTHNALTGLYNRGFFEEEMTRLGRGRQFPVSVVMADLNDLKETNDRDGHAAGDALLQRAAQVFTAAFRAADIIARVGGDEFAVLLPDTDAASAQQSLRRVRHALDEHNAAHGGTRLSIAFGVSTAEQGGKLTDTLKEADARMYEEKRGR